MDQPTAIADSIGATDFFAGMTAAQKAVLLQSGVPAAFAAGQILFHQGDSAERFYFVAEGRLKLTTLHEQGKEAILRYVGPGEVTAAIAVFRKMPYPVTATAATAGQVVGWDKVALEPLMHDHPQLAINLLKVVIDRLVDVQTRYIELRAEQVENRVAHALLRIMRQAGRKTAAGIVIDFKISRQELADYTGATLHTVSRILSAWEKSGWIDSGRERITVCDPHALVLLTQKFPARP